MPGTIELKYDAQPPNDSTPYSDGVLSVMIVAPSIDGTPNSFDWTSNIEVLGVIVKSGETGANWYNYSPDGSTGDTNLQSPDGAQGISHISFCYVPPPPKLTVTKTAEGTYDRIVDWELTKSVDPSSHSGNAGEEAGSSTWTVVATKTETLNKYKVEGEITIVNPKDVPVEISISDILNDETEAEVTCPGTGDHTGTVPASGQLVCDYMASPNGKSATLNKAAVTSNTPGVLGNTATADIEWAESLTGYESGTLSDPRFAGAPWNYAPETISDSATRNFEETFVCPADASLYEGGKYTFTEVNTATLNGNIGLEASASVQIICTLPALEVTKDAAGTFDRTVTWELDKSVDPGSHSGIAGQIVGSSNWTVDAIKSESRGNYKVEGQITIHNPAAIAQSFTVNDVLDDGTPVAVDCPSDEVSAGGTVVCTYSASPNGDGATLNTATVEAAGNLAQTATAPVSFTVNLVGDDQVTLGDVHLGYENSISSTTKEVFPETFECPADTGQYDNGQFQFSVTNIATLSGATTDLEADATVTVTCTLPEPGRGSLQVTKIVEWNGADVNEAQTFEICVSGPSFQGPNCQSIGFEGGPLTWNSLEPGQYSVTETDPGNDWTIEIDGSTLTVVAGQQATATVTNIHPAPGAETEPARLGDYVWLDLNRDGIQDANEPGVSGVTVLLFQVNDSGQGVFTGQTATTDEDGYYLFDNLEPGQYYVEFVLPSGYSFTVADAGGDDTVNSKAHVPSLTVTVNSESETVQPGGVMAYTIDYANTGDRPADGVSLSFVVPEHMTFDTTSNPGWVCEENEQGATLCTSEEPGAVANGDGGQLTIHLHVNSVVADLPVSVNLTVDIWQTTNGVSFVSTLAAGDEDLRHDAGLVQQPAAGGGDPVQIVEPPTSLRPGQQPGMGGSIFIPTLSSQ